jgi:pimeloyl-ACP methyl ester carboxylesterase
MVMPDQRVKEVFAAMSHGRTRYFEAGTGSDVILVHGAGFLSGGHSWLPVMPALAAHFHVFAVDCLGFGPGDHLEQPYSFAYLVDHLREFQDTLGIERSHVIGHSMGGWLALLLAYESPDRVDRLVDVAGGGSQTRALTSMVQWQPPTEDQIRAGLADLDDLDIDIDDLDLKLVEERIAAAADPVVVASFRGLMDHMTNPETRARYNTIRRMPRIAAPTLVLWGSNDQINAVEMAHTAHDLIPKSRLEVLDGVGHGVIRDAPGAFVTTIVDFLTAT